MSKPIQVAILTASDRAAAGIYKDESGPTLEKFIQKTLNAEIIFMKILPDEREKLSIQMQQWADSGEVDLILVTGGTGFAPSDITPEATRDIIEKEAPGLAEAMRAASLQVTPHAMLSRATCGIRGRSLIVNLPGSPKGARENFQAILPAIPHAISLLREEPDSEAQHLKPLTL